jgi:alpha-ketoglutarate-dependent taurine dioxygenase
MNGESVEMSAQVMRESSQPPDRVESEAAWKASDLEARPWRMPVDAATIVELDRVAAWLADNPDADLESLEPARFDCPAVARTMEDIKATLSRGSGFAVLTGLPSERWDERTARALSWLLCHWVAAPVMQKWTGTRVYEVRDTGATLAHGVRRSLTNLKQDLHTDGPWLPTTADYMALACIRQATAGGMSRIASLVAAHNWLHRTHPELLQRLYTGFWWDRQAEHGADDRPANFLPVYSRDGARLRVRYYDDYIRKGHELMHESLDASGVEALAAMREFVEAPENCFEFTLERGQIFFLNNHLIAHGRSAFVDSSSGERLLLRFWLRPHGGVAFEV